MYVQGHGARGCWETWAASAPPTALWASLIGQRAGNGKVDQSGSPKNHGRAGHVPCELSAASAGGDARRAPLPLLFNSPSCCLHVCNSTAMSFVQLRCVLYTENTISRPPTPIADHRATKRTCAATAPSTWQEENHPFQGQLVFQHIFTHRQLGAPCFSASCCGLATGVGKQCRRPPRVVPLGG